MKQISYVSGTYIYEYVQFGVDPNKNLYLVNFNVVSKGDCWAFIFYLWHNSRKELQGRFLLITELVQMLIGVGLSVLQSCIYSRYKCIFPTSSIFPVGFYEQ